MRNTPATGLSPHPWLRGVWVAGFGRKGRAVSVPLTLSHSWTGPLLQRVQQELSVLALPRCSPATWSFGLESSHCLPHNVGPRLSGDRLPHRKCEDRRVERRETKSPPVSFTGSPKATCRC